MTIRETYVYQAGLNALGFDCGAPDGVFGPATIKADDRHAAVWKQVMHGGADQADQADQADGAGKLRVSRDAIELVKHFESLKDVRGDGRIHAYPDPAHGWKMPTIGWGTVQYRNGRRVKRGDVISRAEADAQFEWEMEQKAAEVASLLTVPVNANQFGALVSFAYNVGSDIDADTKAEGLGDSTLLKKVNRGDFAGAAEQFIKWNRANGRAMPGLTRRRLSERRLFLGIKPYIVTMDEFNRMG